MDHRDDRRAMADPKGEKRLTNVSRGVRDHATKAGENTSKLSPYFALGVLSPRWAFRRWWGASATARAANQAVPSSAVAQLLWRETFHAASRLPHWWATRAKHLPRAARFWRHEPDAEKPYGGWRVWKSDDTDPLYKGWLTATTGAPDLDEACCSVTTADSPPATPPHRRLLDPRQSARRLDAGRTVVPADVGRLRRV